MVNKRQRIWVMGVTAVTAVIIMIGLIWWAEASWVSSRASYEASSTSTSSSTKNSTIDGVTSSDSQGTGTGTSAAESTTALGQSSQGISGSDSATDANDPGDGVARDSSSVANSTNPDNGKIVAQVQLTWWDSGSSGISANGAVNNVVENSGSCTLSATRGTVTRTASTQATANATTTSCGELRIPRSELSAGDWTLTLSYGSTTATGQSSAQTVHIA